MKHIIFIAALLVSGLASAYDCSAIKDKSEREYCKAVQSHSRNQCSAISSYDKRQACRVKLGDTPSVCNTVGDGWERAKCKQFNRK